MASPDVLVYSHEWHVKRSGAFLDLVVHPLQRYANVDHVAWVDEISPKSWQLQLWSFVKSCRRWTGWHSSGPD